jgi:hypothetical protein
LSSLLGTVWSSKFLPVYLLYKMLKKMNLLYPLLYFSWFMVVVLPSFLGTYAYLVTEGVPEIFAGAATVGIVFGGNGIEVWNAVLSLKGASLLEVVAIVFGAATSVLRFIGFFYIFNWLSDKWEATISGSYKFIIGIILLGLCTLLALFVDLYVLPDSSQLSGWTYVATNPEIMLDPLNQFLGQSTVDTSQALNSSVNNSSVRG